MNISGEIKIEMQTPSTEAEDIRRCLQTLFGTRVGELALDRDFGIDWRFLDMPLNTAIALFTAEIIEKAQKYEPRAAVGTVTWSADAAKGIITPKVVMENV